MSFKYLKRDPSKTISWADGKSSEIFIFPSTGNFQSRDFLFRISVASVETDKSEFTPLPNISRTLMLLEGEHTLNHEGHHTRSMQPFDQDIFQGDWHTSAKGKATNFNLMCKPGAVGTLEHMHAQKESAVFFDIQTDFELIYLHAGSANYAGQHVSLGDCILIEYRPIKQLKVTCLMDCDFVQTSVKLAK